MWEISIWFFAFLFAINGFLVWFAADITDYELISPFTNSTYTPPALPNINNTMTQITSTLSTNATGGPIVALWDTASFAWNATIYLATFIYGSISGSFLITMGMPSEFLTILYGTEMVFVAITILHFWRGIF